LRILVKSIRVPEGRRSAFLADSDQGSERSDAGGKIVAEVIGMDKGDVERSTPERSVGLVVCFCTSVGMAVFGVSI
jgi:hypothetical protein